MWPIFGPRRIVNGVAEAKADRKPIGFRVLDREISRYVTEIYKTRGYAINRADLLNGRYWREAEEARSEAEEARNAARSASS